VDAAQSESNDFSRLHSSQRVASVHHHLGRVQDGSVVDIPVIGNYDGAIGCRNCSGRVGCHHENFFDPN
jgi:hypothetical protein